MPHKRRPEQGETRLVKRPRRSMKHRVHITQQTANFAAARRGSRTTCSAPSVGSQALVECRQECFLASQMLSQPSWSVLAPISFATPEVESRWGSSELSSSLQRSAAETLRIISPRKRFAPGSAIQRISISLREHLPHSRPRSPTVAHDVCETAQLLRGVNGEDRELKDNRKMG
jgi:hypothetical protein